MLPSIQKACVTYLAHIWLEKLAMDMLILEMVIQTTLLRSLKKTVYNFHGEINTQLNKQIRRFAYFTESNVVSVFQLTSFLHQEWTDELLQWDPKSFEGLKRIVAAEKKIWKPNLLLNNAYVCNASLLQCC